jgi:hypothetical protein
MRSAVHCLQSDRRNFGWLGAGIILGDDFADGSKDVFHAWFFGCRFRHVVMLPIARALQFWLTGGES